MKKKRSSFFGMQFLTSTISTTLVLLLLGLVVFFVLTANNLSVYVRENIPFSIEMSDDASDKDIQAFQRQLEKQPFVKDTKYISKEEANKEQAEAMGTDPSEFIHHNPFPSMIEIRLNAAYANTDSIIWVANDLKKESIVEKINYPQELIDSVNRNIQKASLILLGLAALLTFISFALINNTIRLIIYSKRFLIYTMKLVGANWNFIRRPFLIRNLLLGVLSAVLADAILLGMNHWLMGYEPDLALLITNEILLIVLLSVFVFGLIITGLCAYISINKFLRMKVSDLYQ